MIENPSRSEPLINTHERSYKLPSIIAVCTSNPEPVRVAQHLAQLAHRSVLRQ
jgi:hypothetical protein